ncbi:hypothetical protein LPB67_02920 [Undibacterium sp. Jales W-56]|uniref:hypothetical protein n=1 Tax=Undibacterium sp. Jales W-56 TaxID=2897325 RepID=UPI0021CFA294|nr:hypothetical protein [Undibacterium sp. Jales W-56]MCU6432729.1 hypothetical protein [Undibacterium sp. Jales W-56]
MKKTKMIKLLKLFSKILFSSLLLSTLTGNSYAVTPQSGWWWNPSEGGRGFTLEVQNGSMFMAGYLYDQSGRATWYAAGPSLMNGSNFTAQLTTYLGGQTLDGSYHPTTGTMNSGTISMNFKDPSHGTLTWPGGTIPIERFDIVPSGASSVSPAGSPETGWWWNASEGGRGFSVEIQNGTMFLAGYMYDSGGNPIWYASGPTAMVNQYNYQGKWQQYGNGQTLTGLYKPASVVNGNAGSVSLTFNSPTTATLILPNGVSIPLSRFNFGGATIPTQNFAGTYAGTYSGYDTGTFNVAISPTGVISGSGYSNTDKLLFNVTGSVGSGGSVSMTTSGSAGSALFTGKIDSSTGVVSGTWNFVNAPTYGGAFNGKKL